MKPQDNDDAATAIRGRDYTPGPVAFLLFSLLAIAELGLFAPLLSVYILPVALIVLVWRAWRPAGPHRFTTPLMLLMLVSVSIFSCAFSAGFWAPDKAREISAACHEFRHDRGDYPAQLDELVPDYLPSVPSANPFLPGRDFRYFNPPDLDPLLVWVVVPPFGRGTYNIETNVQSGLD